MAEIQHRALVAADDESLREATREALAEAGIECEAADSGELALSLVRGPEVGVAVVDLAVDGGRGFELAQRLREVRDDLRVIVASGPDEQEQVLAALRLGASDYLAKPVHDEELVLAVSRALAGYGVETRWRRLRERLGRLDAVLRRLDAGGAAPGDEALPAFAEGVNAAVGDLLEAGKVSFLVLDEERNELRVVAAMGSPLSPGEMDPVALGEGVAGVALSLGEAVLVEDIYTDHRFTRRAERGRYETDSLAVVPLRRGERPLGVICATDRLGGTPFGEDELSLLKVLALPAERFLARVVEAREQAAAAPEPEPVPEPLPTAPAEDFAAELAREICEAITREVEPRRVVEGVLRPVARRLPASLVSLHLIDNPSGELVLEGQADALGPDDRERLPRHRGLTASVLQTGALVASEHPERDPRFDPEVDTAADGIVRPLLCVPVRMRGKTLGLVRVFPEKGAGASARTGEILSATLSAAVRNVLLYRSLLETIEEVAEARREAGR